MPRPRKENDYGACPFCHGHLIKRGFEYQTRKRGTIVTPVQRYMCLDCKRRCRHPMR